MGCRERERNGEIGAIKGERYSQRNANESKAYESHHNREKWGCCGTRRSGLKRTYSAMQTSSTQWGPIQLGEERRGGQGQMRGPSRGPLRGVLLLVIVANDVGKLVGWSLRSGVDFNRCRLLKNLEGEVRAQQSRQLEGRG